MILSTMRKIPRLRQKLSSSYTQRKTFVSSSSKSRLSPSQVERALRWYQTQLDIRPLFTKCLTSGFIAGSGDILCQCLVIGRNIKGSGTKSVLSDVDLVRTLRFSFLGTFLIGGVLHYWYGALNKYIVGNSGVSVIKRTMLDQTIMAPSFMATFMSSLFVLEQGLDSDTEVLQSKLGKDWWETVQTNWFVWIPAQVINFGLVQPQYQVLFSNCVGLGWNSYLSFKATSGRHQK